MSLCLRMEDGGGKEGRTKTSWISGRTLLLYSVICRNCLKGMALAIHLLRADGKIFGVQACQKLPSQEKCPKQNRHKKWRLGCFPSRRSTPGTLSLRYGNRPDNAMLFCSRHDVVHLYLSYSLYSPTGTPSFSLSSFTCCSTESYSYAAAAWQTSFCTSACHLLGLTKDTGDQGGITYSRCFLGGYA